MQLFLLYIMEVIMRKHNAFTMIELVIVLAVIGILAAILIPVLSSVITKSNAKSALTDARHIAEQYVMNVFEKKGAPETMVIVIEKGGVYWLFGYDRDAAHNGNRLMISKQNPYKEKDFMKNDAANAVMDNWSFNSRHEGTQPDATGATQYVPSVDGTFWLVPYRDNGAKVYDVRDFTPDTPSYDNEKYMVLNTSSAVDVGDNINASYTADGEDLSTEGDILAYHGLLLPGTYTFDEDEVNTTAPDGTDMNTTYYTLSFLMGDTEGKFNPTDYGTTLPSSVQIPAGTTVYPSTYTITNPPSNYTYKWDRTTAFRMNRNMTLTAEWTEKPSYTVSFNVGDGETFNADSLATAKATMESAGFTWTETTSGPKITKVTLSNGSSKLYAGTSIAAMFDILAEKDGHTFQGWKTATGSTINNLSGASEKLVTGNMSFSPVFVDNTVMLHVIINANNGNSAQNIEQDVAYGSTITLDYEELRITPPTGKVFGYWSWSLSGTQFGHQAVVTIESDVTFTAQWTADELTVTYTSDNVPQKATSAGLSPTLPESVTYTSANRPAGDVITIGGASLSWYKLRNEGQNKNYTVLLPDLTSVNANEGDSIDISAFSSGEILVTPQFVPKQAKFTYVSGGYNIDDWDTLVSPLCDDTEELIDVKDGYTVCTSDLTCNEGFKFEGWIVNSTHVYEPGDTYPVTEDMDDTTITFLAYFNEEELANVCRIVFNFYDYRNYDYPANDAEHEAERIAAMRSHTFFTYTSNVPFGYTLNEELMSANMPTKADLLAEGKSIKVTSAGGAEYDCELIYDWSAEVLGDYVPMTVSASTPQNTEVWIPTYAAVKIDDEYYSVIKTAEGYKNIDRGECTYQGNSHYRPTMLNNYVLANNITLSGNTAPLGFLGNNTQPASIQSLFYAGHFNGLGYTISGFHFNPSGSDTQDYVAMFSYLHDDAIVENFKLQVDGTVQGDEYVGAIAGTSCGTIKNVVVDLQVQNAISGYIIVGGIVGCNSTPGVIEDCHVISSVNSTKIIVARGAQEQTGSEMEECPFSNGQALSGSFLGGIAGANDLATIRKCSVGPTATSGIRFGINPMLVGLNSSTGNPHISRYIGGITGVNAGGMVDQCWVYNVDLCREYYVTNGNFNHGISGLQAVGGITGANEFSSTLQHCWSKGVRCSAELAAGGITGMHNNGSNMTDCWVYFGGADVTGGNSSYRGDIVAAGAVGPTATISNCAIWDAMYSANMPSGGVTNYSSLASQTPSAVGLSDTYFLADANGPMLKNNPFRTSF